MGIEIGDVLLGKYEIEALLAEGGMGLVYRARHLHLREPVAIKVLRADVQRDAEALARFQQEAKAAVRLKSPHVARIHDVGELPSGVPYMVMELLAGADLGALVDAGPTDVPHAVDLMMQACDALAEAHAAGIVHRDVKPSNLFVTTAPDGSRVLKILDFGISKSATGADLALTQTHAVLGTPAYMSPEQMRSARRVDPRTDIWSLGTVLYELVEGRRPFRAETFSEMCVMVAADPHEPMTVAPELAPIVARCLAKAPDARYPSIAELAAELAPFARDRARAAQYVARIARISGRAVIEPRPVSARPVPMPKPPHAPPTLSGDPGTLSGAPGEASDETRARAARPSRAGLLIAVLVVVAATAAAATAIGIARRRDGARDDATRRHELRLDSTPIVRDARVPVVIYDAGPPTDAVAVPPTDAILAIENTGSGSASKRNRPVPVKVVVPVRRMADDDDDEDEDDDEEEDEEDEADDEDDDVRRADHARTDVNEHAGSAGSAGPAAKCDPFASPRPCR